MNHFTADGLFFAFAVCMSIYLVLDYGTQLRPEQDDAEGQVAS